VALVPVFMRMLLVQVTFASDFQMCRKLNYPWNMWSWCSTAVQCLMFLFVLLVVNRWHGWHCCIHSFHHCYCVVSSDVEDKLASRPKFGPRTRPRIIVLGLEHLSLARPQTSYFGLVKMSVMMELIITVSLQWLSTKVIYLLTLCYWYKLVQVHVHDSI